MLADVEKAVHAFIDRTAIRPSHSYGLLAGAAHCDLFDHTRWWRLPHTRGRAGVFATAEPYLHIDPDECARKLVEHANSTGRYAHGTWTVAPVPPDVHPGFWNPPNTKLFVLALPSGPTAAEIVAMIARAFDQKAA